MSAVMYDYLMDDLSEMADPSLEDSEQIVLFLELLSAVDEFYPEIMLKLYSSPFNFDQDKLKRGVDYFSGLGFLSVECCCVHDSMEIERNEIDVHEIDMNDYRTCIGTDKNSEWFARGFDTKKSKGREWQIINEKIATVKVDLLQ